jgi:monoamine oxidase
MAEGFDAADTSRVSARDIANEWRSSLLDTEQTRPDGGYSSLLIALSNALGETDLKLQHEVRTIDWSRHRVIVAGQMGAQHFEFRAKRAVITLPLGVLQQADGVRFSPELQTKQFALGHLAAGAVVKLVMKFRSPFWRDLSAGAYRNVSFFHGTHESFATFWTALPSPHAVLTAWAGGPRATRLSTNYDKEAQVQQALESLEQVFGVAHGIREQLEFTYTHDWQSDPFSRGAYSYVTVGGGEARQQLSAPMADTLFFAGEATHPDAAATVDGALQTGERAAQQIIAAS